MIENMCEYIKTRQSKKIFFSKELKSPLQTILFGEEKEEIAAFENSLVFILFAPGFI